MVVGVLWHVAPSMGYAAGIGAFFAGRLGFAGSLGIDVPVENGKGRRLNLERRSRRR